MLEAKLNGKLKLVFVTGHPRDSTASKNNHRRQEHEVTVRSLNPQGSFSSTNIPTVASTRQT
jgi:hypothetical protein